MFFSYGLRILLPHKQRSCQSRGVTDPGRATGLKRRKKPVGLKKKSAPRGCIPTSVPDRQQNGVPRWSAAFNFSKNVQRKCVVYVCYHFSFFVCVLQSNFKRENSAEDPNVLFVVFSLSFSNGWESFFFLFSFGLIFESSEKAQTRTSSYRDVQKNSNTLRPKGRIYCSSFFSL